MGIFNKSEPSEVTILEKQLQCPVCNCTTFWSRDAQLNNSVSTFFNLDWTDKSATCFVCSACTHIQWFLGK